MILGIIILFIIWISLSIIIPYFSIFPKFENNRSTKKTKNLIKELKGKTKLKTLENIYNYMILYEGYKQKLKLSNYPALYESNINKLLEKKFLSCHQYRYVLKNLILESNQFKKSEIDMKIIITKYITIHQYLIITINNSKFRVDPFYRKFKKIN